MRVRLDLFVNKRIMNPLFGFAQRWLHINRYRIIFIALSLSVLSYLGMIVSQIDYFIAQLQSGKWTLATGWAPPFIAVFFTVLFWDMYLRNGSLAMVMRALHESSSRLEAGGASRQAAILIHLAVWARKIRLDANLVLIVVTVVDVFLVIVRPEVFVPPLQWIASWMLLFWQLVTLHAQDANDIDPRDRVTFRLPKLVKLRA